MVIHNMRVSLIFLCLTLFIWQSGCAHQPPLLSEKVRAQLGTIGVVSARFVPEVDLETPAEGSLGGTGRGVAKGAALGFSSSAQMLGGERVLEAPSVDWFFFSSWRWSLPARRSEP